MDARIGNIPHAEYEQQQEQPQKSEKINILRIYQVICCLLYVATLAAATVETTFLITGRIKEHGVLAFWLFAYIFWVAYIILKKFADEKQKEEDTTEGIQYVFTQEV